MDAEIKALSKGQGMPQDIWPFEYDLKLSDHDLGFDAVVDKVQLVHSWRHAIPDLGETEVKVRVAGRVFLAEKANVLASGWVNIVDNLGLPDATAELLKDSSPLLLAHTDTLDFRFEPPLEDENLRVAIRLRLIGLRKMVNPVTEKAEKSSLARSPHLRREAK